MIGYVTVGTNDLDKAAAYFDALFAEMGIQRLMEVPGYYIAWGPGDDAPGIAVSKPFNQEPATVGNGTMVALAVENRDQVNALHAKALELGGTDEGAPGFRPEESESGFYGAYFRDLDGNKFNFFYMVPE